MTTRSALWRHQLIEIRRRGLAGWAERTSRERLLLSGSAIVVGLALVWSLGLQPALATIAQSREQLPRLHADAAQVEALIIEARALRHRQSGKLDAAGLAEALGASLQRAGLASSSTMTEMNVPRNDATRQWEVVLDNADAERVMEWLASLPHLLRLHAQAVELNRASIDGRDRPGYVTGRIVVGQPAEPTP
jgi:general secretion pathway protein M